MFFFWALHHSIPSFLAHSYKVLNSSIGTLKSFNNLKFNVLGLNLLKFAD